MYFNELIFEFSHQNSTINMTFQVQMLPFLPRNSKTVNCIFKAQAFINIFSSAVGVLIRNYALN